MKLAVIVLNWNNYDLLRGSLASLTNITFPPYEVIVVDNGSTDDSTKRVQIEFPQYTYMYKESKNDGFSVGNNIGLRFALARGAQYCFLMSNDTRVTSRDCFERMIAYMDANPDVGMLGPKLITQDGVYQRSAKPFPTLYDSFRDFYFIKKFFPFFGPHKNFDPEQIQNTDYIVGAAFLMRSETMRAIGIMDERFFFGHEDADFSKRTANGGWRVIYFPHVSVIHIHKTSYQHLRDLDYQLRERLRYIRIHHTALYTFFFRALTSAEALIQMFRNALFWFTKKKEIYKLRTQAYGKASYRMWIFPWRGKTITDQKQKGRIS